MGIIQDGSMVGARRAYEKNDCSRVYYKLSRAEAASSLTPELEAEISYLRASCLEKEGKYDEAVTMYYYLMHTAPPNSQYSYRGEARLRKLEKKHKLTN